MLSALSGRRSENTCDQFSAVLSERRPRTVTNASIASRSAASGGGDERSDDPVLIPHLDPLAAGHALDDRAEMGDPAAPVAADGDLHAGRDSGIVTRHCNTSTGLRPLR
jgi:hypothetical protein